MATQNSPNIELTPITIRDAKAFVLQHHRHNKPPAGCKFSIGVTDGEQIVGVAMVGRPVSRNLDDGRTAEVLRVCVLDDAPKNTCSMLYGASWRAWKAMGGNKILTYTLTKELGASVRGAGWTIVHETRPQGWDRPNRPRKDQLIYSERKYRWEVKR